uniref:Lebocin-4 n=1 Tax=Bombyx mori TaxID=7091 RepID=LEB4_BOMMO|nr:RecName: Full=Lebocin-4; Short=Leb 4; Flags: Precursor [Bombyx mori]BAA22884.1 lebocin 4 [Bombyx mori]
MYKFLVFSSVLVLFFAQASCQRFIQPTYRPPPTRRPIIRTARQAGQEPLWLYQGDNIPRAPSTADHPILPSKIDDVKLDPNRRYVRSVTNPENNEASIESSHHTVDIGLDRPIESHRNTRDLRFWNPREKLPLPTLPPFNPKPIYIDMGNRYRRHASDDQEELRHHNEHFLIPRDILQD